VTRQAVFAAAAAAVLLVPAGYAVQEFTLEEAQTRIERLEARVAGLETAVAGRGSEGAEAEAEETRTVSGSVYLAGFDNFSGIGVGEERVCFGTGGFDDLRSGASVRVIDAAGDVIATTRLEGGRAEGAGCEFTFTASVPETDFYEIQVAGRGGPAYSFEDLEAADWTVSLSIGD